MNNTFGGEAIWDIDKRINFTESYSFTFTDEAGEPYIFQSEVWEFRLKRYQGDKKNIFILDNNSGIDVTDNVVTITITYEQSNIDEGQYYYQLLNDGNVKINGECNLYSGI